MRSRGNDQPDRQKEKVSKVKSTSDGKEAVMDAELVLYEFIAVLVRVAFWRANPDFGLWLDKKKDGAKDAEEVIPVPLALSSMLNDVVLPRAKRENSAAFRETEMKDAKLLEVLQKNDPRLRAWFEKNVGKAIGAKKPMLTFEHWLRILDRQSIVGVWEVEQRSAITGDLSTKGNIKIRLSIPTCKAAFMDSQRVEQLGVGVAAHGSEQAALDYEEWLECLSRVAVSKYGAIKQYSNAAKLEAFLQNWFGEFTEEECIHRATYIKADRYDFARDSRPLPGESDEDLREFWSTWKAIRLDGLYGFPLWEQDVFTLLHSNYNALRLIFRGYCRSLEDAAVATTMSLEEFEDFAVDVGLPTSLQTNPSCRPAVYTLSDVKHEFLKANESGKGLAGPKADDELELPEFLACITRVAFHRLNPEYGELTMEHQETILPVPQCLERTLNEAILPTAKRDDAGKFRESTMRTAAVVSALDKYKPQLLGWFKSLLSLPSGETLPDSARIEMAQWISTLQELELIGTTTILQGSDVVGDDRVGTEVRSRLSVPQAKAAFLQARRDRSSSFDDTVLDFDELLECIARCGVDKYRSVAGLSVGDKVGAMVANLLGERSVEQVMVAATYIKAERFVPLETPTDLSSAAMEAYGAFRRVWECMPLASLPGFPLWEAAVFEILLANDAALHSIFHAYAASSLEGSTADMESDEFRDFAIECGLSTERYGYEAMLGEFKAAKAGSNDKCLVYPEFLVVLVRVSFFRANPHHGMRRGDDRKARKNVDQKNADKFGAEVPLPDCLLDLLHSRVLPHARTTEYAAEFRERVLPLPEVQQALTAAADELHVFYEMTSAGRPYLQLEQWLRALEKACVLSDLTVTDNDGKPWPVRLTEPQAKSAFYAAAKLPEAGLLPEELNACVARCGCDKYKFVLPMSSGAKVYAFVTNILSGVDEEEAVRFARVPTPPRPPTPPPLPPPPEPEPPPAEVPAEPPAEAPAPEPEPAKPAKRTFDRFGGIVRAGH